MLEVKLRNATVLDGARLVEIWRAAVESTHLFLSPADIDGYAGRLEIEFFPVVQLVVAERDGKVLGFSGTVGHRLEMMFVDPDAHGQGIGTALLDAVVAAGVDEVDVNEQNPGATEFYLRRGFGQVGRSPVDADGRPFPLLHLRRPRVGE